MYVCVCVCVCGHARCKYFVSVDGLSIAVQLSRRITTVSSQMKTMLHDFNEGLPVDDRMSWEAACNIHRHSYTASLSPVDSIPLEVKHEAVKKFQSIVKSSEEMMLSKQEMYNCLDYYVKLLLHLHNSHQGILELMINEDYKDMKLSGYCFMVMKKIALFSKKIIKPANFVSPIHPSQVYLYCNFHRLALHY